MLRLALPNRETLPRIVRFMVVGGGSALVQVIVMGALAGRVQDRAAFVISWAGSTLAHYLSNRFWALPSARRDAARQFGEYLMTIGLSLLIQWGAFELFYSVLGFDAIWSTVLAIPPSTIVVFLMLNYRVFGK